MIATARPGITVRVLLEQVKDRFMARVLNWFGSGKIHEV